MSNVQLVRDAYDCFGRGDIPTLLGMMDPNIEWSEAEGNPYQPSGKAWNGPDAISIDPNGNLWVVDAADDRVEEFTECGQYLSSFGTGYNGVGGTIAESGTASVRERGGRGSTTHRRDESR